VLEVLSIGSSTVAMVTGMVKVFSVKNLKFLKNRIRLLICSGKKNEQFSNEPGVCCKSDP